MNAKVKNVEDRRYKNFYVDVQTENRYIRFDTAHRANLYLSRMKDECEDHVVVVEWNDIIITPKKTNCYQSVYTL